jgi:hypothetical protein
VFYLSLKVGRYNSPCTVTYFYTIIDLTLSPRNLHLPIAATSNLPTPLSSSSPAVLYMENFWCRRRILPARCAHTNHQTIRHARNDSTSHLDGFLAASTCTSTQRQVELQQNTQAHDAVSPSSTWLWTGSGVQIIYPRRLQRPSSVLCVLASNLTPLMCLDAAVERAVLL